MEETGQTPPRTGPGKTTLLYRQVRINRDLAILALIIAVAAILGYTVRGFEFSLEKIAKIVGEIVTVVILVLWKIHTPQGKLSETLATRANKPEKELDEWGRSLPGVNR